MNLQPSDEKLKEIERQKQYFLDPEQMAQAATEADERPDLTDLKIEINEIVWRNASNKTTLEQADNIACAFWQAICDTHD